jgi:hypothetical protein
MKKLVLFVAFVVAFLFFIWKDSTRLEPLYLSKVEKTENTEEAIALIRQINFKNSKIRNLTGNVRIQSKYRLRAVLFYEKDLKFRMQIKSITGLESDIGSNSDYFWFWSKRMKPPALYFAKHEDIYKTRLKTPLHPVWIMETLGVGKIHEGHVWKMGNNWLILEARKGTNEPVIKATLIDSNLGTVIGHYLFDKNGKIIVSVEVKSFYKGCPKEMIILWYKENIQMIWTFRDLQINTNIDDRNWGMPDMNNKINMGD